ncbi:MAG TPA: HAD family hydrolase [Actinomycetota bacterium]|jgi:HAD superfamily hydrolase (TIGR01490 family)
MNRAAFFDLDKTLIPGSSLFLLARGLYERDFLRARHIAKFAWTQFLFVALGRERMGEVDDIQEAAFGFVKGRHQDELRQLGREIAQERILPRVYEDIARVIEHHHKLGDETWLITAAPQELAEVIAEGLGMTGGLGTRSELDDSGIYTGRLAGELLHGPEKAKAVERLAADRSIDLRESHAYSDSINDMPLLESVGEPHAVNPDHELRRLARARGWPVHELRSRRRALLIGIPSTIAAAGLFSAGVAIGLWLNRRSSQRG